MPELPIPGTEGKLIILMDDPGNRIKGKLETIRYSDCSTSTGTNSRPQSSSSQKTCS